MSNKDKRFLYIGIFLWFFIIPILTAYAYDSSYTGAQVDAAVAAHIGRNTAVGDPGSDAEFVTEQAVREALDLKQDLPAEGAFADGDKTKLDGIETSATTDQTDAEIETAYNNQVSVMSQVEAEAGTATTVRRVTAQRIAQAIAALAPGGVDEFVYQSDCSGITNGLCVDSDDDYLYYYDGDAVVQLYPVTGFESSTSNDFDPDRLAGDTTDDDLVDQDIIEGFGGSATPKATLNDTDGADGYWDVNAADADDAVATLGVDDSTGDDTPYVELDGVNERVEIKKDLDVEGVMYISEQADANADRAGYGQIWVNTATPNELYFTDDAGTDFQLGLSASGDSISIDSVAVVDPDFQSGGDIDFVDTSNVVTANLNADVVDEAHIADNGIDSEHYNDGSIDPVHVASGVWDFGTSVEADTLTEGGNAVYNSTETPGGELGGTWASPTVDDTGITLTSITIGSLLGVDSIDATGAVDMDYGSGDVTDHTFTSDGGVTIIDGATIDMGAAGVRVSTDGDGAITFLGLGDGSDEDLTINLDDTANTASVSSSTGLDTVDFGSIAMATTGTILGASNIVTTTDGTESPTAAQMYGTFFVADHATATSDTDYTLPTAAAGMTACFYDNGAGTGGIIVDASAGDEILLDGTGIGVAEAIDSPGVAGDGANGDFICLMAIDATSWVTLGASGTWVDGGAD